MLAKSLQIGDNPEMFACMQGVHPKTSISQGPIWRYKSDPPTNELIIEKNRNRFPCDRLDLQNQVVAKAKPPQIETWEKLMDKQPYTPEN